MLLERDGYVPGVPCWVDTTQPDPEGAAAFYGGLFGWEFSDAMPPGSPGRYLTARLHGGAVAAVGSGPEDGPAVAAWNTYIWVQSADRGGLAGLECRRSRRDGPVRRHGCGPHGRVHRPGRGRLPSLGGQAAQGRSDRQRAGLVELQQPEHTRPRRAKSFYRDVFAWDTLGLGGGVEMWRLAGYGDFLEQSDPGLRQRMADTAAAPDGFEDVVASLNPIADDQPEVPAHWSVTFAVDDADATAERAAALGGRVIVPPFDAPWVRMTVITDPQGATFTASKFVPENHDLGRDTQSAARAA